MSPAPAARLNLSDDLTQAVRELIVDGGLAPGEHINEVHLARRLAVSRTPLREALMRLTAAGFIDSRPRRGFFARGLSVAEAEQLYPLRALLDPEALRMAGLPDAARIAALRRLNARLADPRTRPARAIDLDDEWHRMLLADCPNRVLLELIDQMIWRTRRYEHAYLSERRNVALATGEHEAILAALERGDLAAACSALAQNMISAREPLLRWLRQREPRQ